jgi:hypothetical protein
MARWKKTTGADSPSTEDHLRRVAEAGTVAFGGVGFAGTVLPETEAYFALEEALPTHAHELRGRLERLLDGATPAGKIYAAELLTRIDPAAGRSAWTRLAGDNSNVQTFSGCVMDKTTLGGYARERLGG